MKRFLVCLLALVLVLASLPAFAEYAEVMTVVNCNEYVSLRSSPDTKAGVLAKVHLGEFVYYCYDSTNGFTRCTFNGVEGYILTKYLKKSPYTMSDNLLPNQMVYNCDEYVSLREKPDTKSTRLVKVPKGAIVTSCVGYMGNWVLCSYSGKTGYILAQYLTEADYNSGTTPSVTEKPSQYPELPYYMTVTNCSEWVSLRDRPSTSGKQLERVPLGAQVEGCVQVSDQFVECTYNGVTGYIRIDMLTEVSGFAVLSDNPSYVTLLATGVTVLASTFENGYSVLVQHMNTDSSEELMAVCYDENMQPLWSLREEQPEVAQVDGLNAFIAGTSSSPKLVIFHSGYGFIAYEISSTKTISWVSLGNAAQQVSGGLTTACEEDGTMYVIGYFDSAPICLNADGSVRWQAVNSNSDIFWPFSITIGTNTVSVYYDSCYNTEDSCYCVTYSKTGIRKSVTTVTTDSIPKGIIY